MEHYKRWTEKALMISKNSPSGSSNSLRGSGNPAVPPVQQKRFHALERSQSSQSLAKLTFQNLHKDHTFSWLRDYLTDINGFDSPHVDFNTTYQVLAVTAPWEDASVLSAVADTLQRLSTTSGVSVELLGLTIVLWLGRWSLSLETAMSSTRNKSLLKALLHTDDTAPGEDSPSGRGKPTSASQWVHMKRAMASSVLRLEDDVEMMGDRPLSPDEQTYSVLLGTTNMKNTCKTLAPLPPMKRPRTFHRPPLIKRLIDLTMLVFVTSQGRAVRIIDEASVEARKSEVEFSWRSSRTTEASAWAVFREAAKLHDKERSPQYSLDANTYVLPTICEKVGVTPNTGVFVISPELLVSYSETMHSFSAISPRSPRSMRLYSGATMESNPPSPHSTQPDTGRKVRSQSVGYVDGRNDSPQMPPSVETLSVRNMSLYSQTETELDHTPRNQTMPPSPTGHTPAAKYRVEQEESHGTQGTEHPEDAPENFRTETAKTKCGCLIM